MLRAMKSSHTWKSVTVLTLFAFMLVTVTPSLGMAETAVSVPSGTVVTVSTVQTITPESLNVGDVVNMTVANDVVVDGNVVIKAGARATAEVIRAKNRNMIGIAAAVGLAMRSVEAVDGTVMTLFGTKIVEGKDKMVMSIGLSLICCLLFALMKGGDAEIPAGMLIQTTVATATTISVP